jgi:hypothetical protein
MVNAELARHFEGPFVWGVSDCCTCACDAFRARFGIDPMAPLRGMYATEAEAAALIKDWGGWNKLFKSLSSMAGLKFNDPPHWSNGAIGLAGQIGAGPALVFGAPGGLWIGKVDGGFATTNTVILSCHS